MVRKRTMGGTDYGTSAILAGQLTKTLTHNLGVVPTEYGADAITNSLGQDIYVQSVTATQIVVAMDNTQAADVNFSWHVKK